MNVVQVENLVKRFRKIEVLKKISFKCNSGETVVLLGPNGSGKSTTLRILSGLVKPNGGKVKVLNKDPYFRYSRINISYLPQKVSFPKSYRAKDILFMFANLRKVDKRRVEYIIERFSLKEWLKMFIGELSGGMVQRLALAVTFLPEVPLYLLDEPSNNLDFEGLQAFRNEVQEVINRDGTIILSTHSLLEAEILSTRVILLLDGKLIKEETGHSFFEQINKKRRLWIRIANPRDGEFERLISKYAEHVERDFDLFKITIAPEKRFQLLNLLHSEGAIIKEFGLLEPDLEEVYNMFF